MTKKFSTLFFFFLALASCGEKKEPAQPEEKPAFQLQKASFSDLSGWKKDNINQAVEAFKKSCRKILQEKNDYMSNAQARIPVKDYQDVCQKLTKVSPKDYRKFLETNFTPYLVTYENSSEGKFTSYYEAEIHASKTPSEEYKYPVYGRPDDLIEINLQDFDPELPRRRLVGRVENKKFVPYFTRAEIEKNKINAPVVLWGNDHVDIYVMQIQGSAVAVLDDGSRIRIGYAETNGRKFQGIGSILLQKGLLAPGKASMDKIKKWLKENYPAAAEHMNENERFVFHRLVDAEGPLGAHGVPLTAGRSLAVDRQYIPLGALLWLETTGPDKKEIKKLVVAQDIGGAIKGAVRGDYFWGSGGDEILELAGKMHSKGQYYIFVPNKTEIK